MKALLAALLLLFQLQPVLGTAACLGLSDRPVKQECKMSEHGQMPTTSITLPSTVAQSCHFAAICTPAPLAIPASASRLEAAAPPYDGAGAFTAMLPPSISPAPPLRPPRA